MHRATETAVFQPQRVDNPAARLAEFAPAGAAIVFVSQHLVNKGNAMKGDFSRLTFRPARQYSAVLSQQGTVHHAPLAWVADLRTVVPSRHTCTPS